MEILSSRKNAMKKDINRQKVNSLIINVKMVIKKGLDFTNLTTTQIFF